MFGWRRRSEGFEWREHVRTTVLVRRADRQRRMEDMRLAALAKVKNAADAGADAGKAGVSFAGSQFVKLMSAIGVALLDLAVALFEASVRWLKFIFAVIGDALGGLVGYLPRAWPERPAGGSSASGSSTNHSSANRVSAVRASGIRLADRLADAVRGPANAARDGVRMMPDVARSLPIKPRHLLMGAGALAAIYFGGPILRSADGVAVATYTPAATSSQVTVTTEISGRASAVAGDIVRVGGTMVHLDGIEAPASGQPCYRDDGRRWSCASTSRSGLDRIVRGHSVACTASGKDDQGRVLGSCIVDGTTDLATALVRGGYVFAVKSLFGSLSSEEDAAREAKAGMWQGEVIRPQEWRDQAWADAKREAPDGCPIKGTIRASAKVYALPWSADYARARVRTERGERWFCSEDEAKAAGFAPSGGSSGS